MEIDSKATLYSIHLLQFSPGYHTHKQKYTLKEKEAKSISSQNTPNLTPPDAAVFIVWLENFSLMSSCIYTFSLFIRSSVKVRILAILLTAISSVHLGSLIKHVLTNLLIKYVPIMHQVMRWVGLRNVKGGSLSLSGYSSQLQIHSKCFHEISNRLLRFDGLSGSKKKFSPCSCLSVQITPTFAKRKKLELLVPNFKYISTSLRIDVRFFYYIHLT